MNSMNEFEYKYSLWILVDFTNIGQLQLMFDTPLKLGSKVYLDNVLLMGKYDFIDDSLLGVYDISIINSQGTILVNDNHMVQCNQVVKDLMNRCPSLQERQHNMALYYSERMDKYSA